MKKALALFFLPAIIAFTGKAASDPILVPTAVGNYYVTPLPGNAYRIATARTPRADGTRTNLKESANMRTWLEAETFGASGAGYTLSIDRRTGRVSFVASNGDTILSQLPSPSFFADPSKTDILLKFQSPKGFSYYGAGERGQALRQNGDTLRMWNRPNYGYGEGDTRISQMGITVPYILAVPDPGTTRNGIHPYGLLFNDPARAELILGNDLIEYKSESSLPISYTFIGGDNIASVTSNFTHVTGKQDLPPLWSLGYITSKYGYRTDKEALGAVDSLKREGYPVDGIIFDLYWYGKETDMGRLEWNRDQFPHHRAMLDSLNSMGVNTILIHQPYINKTGALDNYMMLAADSLLVTDSLGTVHDVHTWVGDAGMFDISNPATREWLWSRLRDITKDGVYGWWGDLGEPEQHPLTMKHHNGLGTVDYHNIYGNEWSRLIYDGLRKDFPDRRPFLLMRGGSTGLHAYSVFPWTGDVARSWEGLQPQIKLSLNSGLAGLAYMSSDIGGFAVDPEKPYDPELYTRWLQFGVFSPILRTHAQNQPEPYHYPGMHDILLDLIKMRYRWLPYNYSLAFENAMYGQPLMRPVNYYGACSREEMDIDTEYLWGSEVLVAPVMTQGAKSRKVIFPTLGNCDNPPVWINWFNPRETYKGGTVAEVAAPIERFPLFIKAGSFIPQFEKDIDNVRDYSSSILTVNYYPSAEPSEYTMYDDDHLSPGSIENGEYEMITFRAFPSVSKGAKGKSIVNAYDISINSLFGFAGMPETREITLRMIGERRPRSITLNGEPLRFSYDAASRTLTTVIVLKGDAELRIMF